MPGTRTYQRTYLPYPAGIDPKLLRVGTLVLDIFNPTQGKETDRFEFYEDLSQTEYEAKIKDLAGFSELIEPKGSLNFSASKEWGMNAGLIDLVHGGVNSQGEIHVGIEGGCFRRIEMQKPVKFLQELVLKQPNVENWIRNKTTAGWAARLYNGSVKTPKIWVCTGVQLISKAKVRSGTSTGSGQEGGVELDAGLLAGGPPIGKPVAKVEAYHKTENHVDSKYTSEDEAVWCARFFSLRIKLTRPDETIAGAEEKSHAKVLRIELGEVEDLAGSGVREDVSEIHSGEEQDNGKRVAELEGLDLPTGGRFTSQSEPDADNSTIVIGEAPYADAVKGIAWSEFYEYDAYVDSLDS